MFNICLMRQNDQNLKRLQQHFDLESTEEELGINPDEYVLIHQKQVLIERFERKSDNLWVPQIFRDGDPLELKSVGFSGAIATLYENTNLLSSP